MAIWSPTDLPKNAQRNSFNFSHKDQLKHDLVVQCRQEKTLKNLFLSLNISGPRATEETTTKTT